MNVALFGGTFDPVHLGHIAVARAAQQRFDLKRVYIVPADIPPHKQTRAITPYHHRYAMVCLATQGQKDLIPSLLEAPDIDGRSRFAVNYTIDTVRRFKATMKKNDRLFLLIGIDAFLDIGKWREPEALIRESEFIVASRPGFSLADVAGALPETMRPSQEVLNVFHNHEAVGDVVLGGATIHLLTDVNEPASATKVREATSRGRAINRLVDPTVAEYIKKQGLYRVESALTSAVELTQPAEVGGARLQVIQGGMPSKANKGAVRTSRRHKEEQ